MEVVDMEEIMEIKPEEASERGLTLLAFCPQRALVVRLPWLPGREEQRLIALSAPFRGFSAVVRFQCRAKIHHIQYVQLQEPSSLCHTAIDEI